METFARMKTVVDSPVERKAIEDGSDKYADMHKYYYYVSETEGRPFGQVLPSQAFMGDFMKYWRAWGISGMDPYESVDRRLNLNYVPADGPAQYASFKTPGIKTMLRYKPKYSARTILFDKYREWLDPELFFIGGGKKEKFTDKQHAYRGKAIISKSIVWVNDRFEPKSEKMKVELRDASGAPVQQKELDIKAKPGDIQFIEFTLNAPDVAQKTPYTVVLSRKINGQFVEKDKLDMQVHPVDPAGAIAAVKQTRKTWLIDTKGLTKKTLQALKIKFGDPALSSAKLGSGDLLIVGRESISELYKKVPDIAALVKNGLNVLVFEQTKPDLEKYCKLYAVEASARHVFLPISGNPVTKGLSQEDLADWTGEGTLLEAFPVPTKEAYGEHPFKNGNRGMVASVVIEKPHRGAFLHLLHQGFDLAYTPLMEEKIGKGMILYCQLDVTGRTADSPVIELITKNIIDYADKRAAAKETAIVYAGGAHGKDILESSGADFTVAGDLGSAAQDASKDAVLVLGEDGLFNFVTKNRQQLTAHLSKGGTVLLLAVKNPVELARMLGANIIGHSMEGYWFYPKQGETAGMSAGMSAGDFYWKDNFSLPLPDKQYPLYSQNIGPNGGRLIICQIDPLYFTNKEINQRRYRGRYKMNRQVAIVLANLGAQFKGNTPQYMDGIEKQQEIDLAGAWNFKIDLNDKGESEGWYKTEWKDGFKKMNVPGSWESQNELTPNPNVDGKQPYDGYAWYQKTVVIPSSLKGIPLFLEMGNVDDMDWSYFNGQPIGKTGKETKNYYSAKRYYPIPENLIQFDKPNTVTVRCFDEYQEGGLMKGPDKIAFKKPEAFFYLPSDDYAKARFDPYKFYRW
ncbi:MAG: hypothetical protein A2297_09455 [Elusimicrobia bacterium RIFOXYB2_FULL_48_7]|nr:MAG: hypothetical protein A2297_09455 [Elusimicrobia bacterium RIFOXYB2_FULL_48_7]